MDEHKQTGRQVDELSVIQKDKKVDEQQEGWHI